MAGGTFDSITPWFMVWTEPRATIRRIVTSDPRRNVILLAALGPALQALAGAWGRINSAAASFSVFWPIGVAVLVVCQAAMGVAFLYVFGWLYRWSGEIVGGTASSIEVRAALAWAQLPVIAGGAIGILGALAGVPWPSIIPGAFPIFAPSFLEMAVAQFALVIWSIVISLKCIGEVHGFSAWRALGAVLLGFLAIVVVIGTAALFLGLMIRVLRHA